MKKLMLGIAIALIASVSQAAAVQWTLTGIKDHDGNTPVESDKYVAKLMVWTAVSDGAGGYTVGSAVTLTGTSSVNLTNGSIMNKLTGTSDLAASTKYYAQLVIDNGTWKIESQQALFTTPGNGNAALNFGTGKTAFDVESSKIDFAKGWTGGTTPTPEPTSGLLLVLGMAGLALRRKRA